MWEFSSINQEVESEEKSSAFPLTNKYEYWSSMTLKIQNEKIFRIKRKYSWTSESVTKKF